MSGRASAAEFRNALDKALAEMGRTRTNTRLVSAARPSISAVNNAELATRPRQGKGRRLMLAAMAGLAAGMLSFLLTREIMPPGEAQAEAAETLEVRDNRKAPPAIKGTNIQRGPKKGE
ncbi:MAG: hypothetical protein FJW39_20795 [Acidobacteria bacterium]|nr:hypothetical protein [Acidobacteriota bacterium]